nr:hypothetical protein [Candidatus Sigynarchaeota archaeon]
MSHTHLKRETFFCLLFIMFAASAVGSGSTRLIGDSGVGGSGSWAVDESSVDPALTYHVARYAVRAALSGNDLIMQVNITYNVTDGLKSDGYKRFMNPPGTLGYIDEGSIVVRDQGGDVLYHEYSSFSGYDGRQYKEIYFQCPEFSGVRTISMNFIGRGWITEDAMKNTVPLYNIRTFSVSVDSEEYSIVFPDSFVPASVVASVAGTGDTSMVDGHCVYTFTPGWGASVDLEFSYTPKTTYNLVWYMLILPVPVIIVTASMVRATKARNKKTAKLHEQYKLDHKKEGVDIASFSPVELTLIKDHSGSKWDITARLVKAALVELHVNGHIVVRDTGIHTTDKAILPSMDPFTVAVANSFSATSQDPKDVLLKSGPGLANKLQDVAARLATRGFVNDNRKVNFVGGMLVLLNIL